jgi:hypothetical protein
VRIELERELWSFLKAKRTPMEWIDTALADGRIVARSQAVRTLEKWGSRGLYECGVHVENGWLVPGAAFPR